MLTQLDPSVGPPLQIDPSMNPKVDKYLNGAKKWQEEMGKLVGPAESAVLVFSEEFQKMSKKNPALKNAFDALTPGRQRGYFFTFPQPNNPKPGSPELKNACRAFSRVRA